MTALDLAAIKANISRYNSAIGPGGDKAWIAGQLAQQVPALIVEVDRLRAQLDAIAALHTDSPSGPCPTCYRAHDVSDTDDGLVDWPCPTLRAMGVEDIAPKATAR